MSSVSTFLRCDLVTPSDVHYEFNSTVYPVAHTDMAGKHFTDLISFHELHGSLVKKQIILTVDGENKDVPG